MKTPIVHKLALYLYNNFLGNFLGFVVGMASTRLVSHFFATKSIRNLWGLTSRKTLVDKQTFGMLEWTISILIGFIVFEIISKGIKKKLNEMMPTWKIMVKNMIHGHRSPNAADNLSYSQNDAATTDTRTKRFYRDVQQNNVDHVTGKHSQYPFVDKPPVPNNNSYCPCVACEPARCAQKHRIIATNTKENETSTMTWFIRIGII